SATPAPDRWSTGSAHILPRTWPTSRRLGRHADQSRGGEIVKRIRLFRLAAMVGLTAAVLVISGAPAGSSDYSSYKPDCGDQFPLCTEIGNPQDAFGNNYYVGHDEPSLLFYSHTPGSGNHARYQLTMPTEPAGPFSQSKGYDFELRPTFWFGMA